MNRTQRCETCWWWEVFGTGYEAGFGWCHRNAPSKQDEVIIGSTSTLSVWPPTERGDFCGEWQAAEQVRQETGT